MPRQKGMVLTERDRALLGYLGVARYVTAAQAHRLLAPGHDKAVTSRRLASLCEGGAGPGDDPFLRRLQYRRANALPFPVWTLTPHGRAVAEPVAPGPVAVVQPPVGIIFIERILALNELLIALVLAARCSEAAALTSLPFRWRVPDDSLRFETFDRVHVRAQPAVLRPAAVLELPGARRRFFLEPELGASSLSPTDPRQGHVRRRLERYGSFFLAFARNDGRRTWYEHNFPDGYAPEVLVLARTEARRSRIEAAIREHYGRSGSQYSVRAMTTPGAIAELSPLVAPGPARLAPAPPPALPPIRTVAIDDGLARRIRHGMRLFVETFNACRQEAWAHSRVCPMHFQPAPSPLDELNAFADLVWDTILGTPRVPRKDGSP